MVVGTSVLVAASELRHGSASGLRWAGQLTSVTSSVVLVVQETPPERLTAAEWSAFTGGAPGSGASGFMSDDTPVRVVADARDPVVALPELAARHGADMVVVDDATFHRSAVPVEVALSQLLAQVRWPVLVVPEHGEVRPASLRRLVLMVDDPSLVEPALGTVRDLAAAFDSWVSVVLVTQPPADGGASHHADWSERLGVRARLEAICHPLRRSGVPVYQRVQWGTPDAAIRDVVATIDPGLVVVGVQVPAHDRSPISTIDRPAARDPVRPTLLVPGRRALRHDEG
jgi:hypothetical protein